MPPDAPASPASGPPETSSATSTTASRSHQQPTPTPRSHDEELDDQPRPQYQANQTRPPSKHQLALMIWLAVFSTLTVLNLVLGDWLHSLTLVARTFVLATIAVPVVIYGLMPQLHQLRGLPLTRIASSS
jgi:hypothetical protein